MIRAASPYSLQGGFAAVQCPARAQGPSYPFLNPFLGPFSRWVTVPLAKGCLS